MTLVSGHSVSTGPSAAGGSCIKQSDGHRKKRLPLAFCVTPGEDESIAEGASARGQHLVERVSIVVQDIVQYTQHPPLRHHHQRVQLDPQDGASLPDDPTDLPGICCPQPAAPAHNCKKDGTSIKKVTILNLFSQVHQLFPSLYMFYTQTFALTLTVGSRKTSQAISLSLINS